MTGDEGLPYEECRRLRRYAPPYDRTPQYSAFGLPPFRPVAPDSPSPRTPRRQARRVDGAVWSSLLIGLCVGTLLMAIAVTAVRPRG